MKASSTFFAASIIWFKLLTLIVCCALGNVAARADIVGKISDLNLKTRALTVAGDGRITNFRISLSATVTINGMSAKAESLRLGMNAVVQSADPGVASKISAVGKTGYVMPPSKETEAFKEALYRFPWSWYEDPPRVKLRFYPDGTAKHIGMRGTWEVSAPNQVTLSIADGNVLVFQFNKDVTSYELLGTKVKGHRWVE